MSQLVRVSGDYGIKVDEGSTITLDTGLEIGQVIITGELLVKGRTTTIETTNLAVSDNIIFLNVGEVGPGITKETSGIEIERGLNEDSSKVPNARIFFDERIEWFNPLTDTVQNGSWILEDEFFSLLPLRVAALSSSALGDFTIDLRNGPGVLKLVNTNAQTYSDNILNDLLNSDNKIPTTRTLRDYVSAGIITPGVADVDKIYFSNDGGLTILSRVQSFSSNIDFYINESFAAQITAGGLDVYADVNVRGSNLTTASNSFDLINTNATVINFAGAATSIVIGAQTGQTRIRHNVDIDGDVNIDGGDLRVTTGTFNLANTNALTVNFAGAATLIEIGSPNGTTNVNNNLVVDLDLDVNGNDLRTSSSIFNLVNTNATTVNFAGAATTIEIGAGTGTTNVNNNLDVDGDVNIDGGDLTTSQTTFNLLNTTATTVNFAGAATDVQIGAGTGTTNVNNNLNIDGSNLTSTSSTFNLLNTTATTVNFAGNAISIDIGASTGTTSINNNLDVDGDVNIDGGDLTTNQTTFNLLNTTATTVNFAGAATTIEIGTTNGSTTINDINITGNVISSVSADDLFFDGVLALANQISVPAVESGYVKLYSVNTPGTGGTGLYFVNTIGTNDELISKTKALLYSLIL